MVSDVESIKDFEELFCSDSVEYQFSSFEEAIDFGRRVANRLGFDFRVKSTVYSEKDGVIHKYMCCNRQGFSSSSESSRSKSIRCGCRWNAKLLGIAKGEAVPRPRSGGAKKKDEAPVVWIWDSPLHPQLHNHSLSPGGDPSIVSKVRGAMDSNVRQHKQPPQQRRTPRQRTQEQVSRTVQKQGQHPPLPPPPPPAQQQQQPMQPPPQQHQNPTAALPHPTYPSQTSSTLEVAAILSSRANGDSGSSWPQPSHAAQYYHDPPMYNEEHARPHPASHPYQRPNPLQQYPHLMGAKAQMQPSSSSSLSTLASLTTMISTSLNSLPPSLASSVASSLPSTLASSSPQSSSCQAAPDRRFSTVNAPRMLPTSAFSAMPRTNTSAEQAPAERLPSISEWFAHPSPFDPRYWEKHSTQAPPNMTFPRLSNWNHK